jgi:hypothetical protein
MGKSISGEPQISRSQSFGVHPMSRQTQLGSPQMTGQLPLGSHNRQQPSGFHNMDQQQPSKPYQGSDYPIEDLTFIVLLFSFLLLYYE